MINPQIPPSGVEFQAGKPDIIFESEDIISINKPAGLATQAPAGIDSLEWRVKRYLKQESRKSGKIYLGVPHRLDRPASGVIVFAKNKPTARHLADQFQRRNVQKTYWALVSGRVTPDQGCWTDFMRKIPDEAKSEIVASNHPEAMAASLRYKVRRTLNDIRWLEIKLETGRSHQIRLQASRRGFPILGDDLYGSTEVFGPQTEDLRRRHIALHARSLSVSHPQNDSLIELLADPPATWLKFDFAFEK